MADLFEFLGMRYLCLLRGNADWQAQDGAETKPKKSVEGGIGGVAGAALLGVLFALAMNQWGGAQANPLHYAIICAAGGMISQVGDLAASAIKRNHDIKDYGKLIPGHGGILDRFDSVIFTAPVIYYLAALLAGNI